MRPSLTLVLALLAVPPRPLEGQGRMVEDSVQSAALEGNALGDAPVRRLRVYLPPGYDSDESRRYPVLYLLHDFDETADRWSGDGSGPDLARLLDGLVATGKIQPLLVVLPEDRNALGGSGYANSPSTGAWETYFARDLVRHVDARYRTYRRGSSRGIAGYGAGGAAAMRMAMRFPGGLAAVYAMSPRMRSPCDALPPAEAGRLLELTRLADLATLPRDSRECMAQAAAWSPDSARPPFLAALPFARDGDRIVADSAIRERWQAWSLLEMAPRYRDGLVRLRGIRFDAGRGEPAFADAASLDSLLTRLRIRHGFAACEGAAGGRLAERLAESVLPFFSETLDFSPEGR